MAKIIISIDHKWRDLPAYVYIGMILEKKGHDVQWIRNGYEPYYVVSQKPDLIVMIHLYDLERQEFALELKRQGILVVLMPTEGIATLEGYRKFAAGVDNDLSSVDLHFCWNELTAAIVNENPTIDKSNILTIGCPRFDFYSDPLSKIVIKKENFCHLHGLNYHFPIVTFATNFTQAQFHIKNQDFLVRDAEKLGYVKTVEKIVGGLDRMAQRDYESRDLLINAFIKLVKEFEGVNFVLKLHPSEEHLYYYKLLDSKLEPYRKRITIISKAYIWDVLSVSDVEMVRSCTTGIESWMTGKPTIEMKLNPDEWYFSPEHASGSFIATSYESLKEKLQFYLAGGSVDKKISKERQKFLKKWCYKLDGNRSEAVADILDDLLQKSRPDKKIEFSVKKWLVWLLLFLSDYRVHDIKIYGLKMFSSNRVDKLGRIDKFFNRKDVNDWRKRLDKIVNL